MPITPLIQKKHIEIKLAFNHLIKMGLRSGLVKEVLSKNYFFTVSTVDRIVFSDISDDTLNAFENKEASVFFKHIMGLKSVNINAL